MFKYLAIATLLSVASAQVLRLSPLVLGSNQPAGNAQIILLAPGGGVAPRPAGRLVLAQQPAPRPVTIVQAAPQPVRLAAVSAEDESPKPFAFSFESEDEFGTKMSRSENADGSGAVTGSYSYTDATGLTRTVTYVADDNGYRASVDTNEPGTLTSNPADAEIRSSAQ